MREDSEFPLLSAQGLYASQIIGDGNCLFRALADQLYGDPERYAYIRKEVVRYLEENQSQFIGFLPAAYAFADRRSNVGSRKSRRPATVSARLSTIRTTRDAESIWNAYLENMSKDGVYGDNLEIVAFAKRFEVDIKIHLAEFAYIVAGDGATRNSKEISSKRRRLLHIAYHQWEHYSSVRNVNGPHSGLPNIIEVEAPRENVDQAKDLYYQPWMEKVILSSLPDVAQGKDGDQYMRDAIERFKGDVDKVVEYFFEQQAQEKFGAEANETSSIIGEQDSMHDVGRPTIDSIKSRETGSAMTEVQSKAKQRRQKRAREKKEKQGRVIDDHNSDIGLNGKAISNAGLIDRQSVIVHKVLYI